MNEFNYNIALSKLMTPEIMNLVSGISAYQGREEIYRKLKPASLEKLEQVARIQSTESSNRIEGILTTNARLKALMSEKSVPQNRNEAEIAGYRSVLDLIHSSHDDIPVTPSVILQLHRDLYSHQQMAFAGRWKDSDNVIMERRADGDMYVRFRPTSAIATPHAIESLCSEYNKSINEHTYSALLATALFAFDFVSIHPFLDGNGRMSRLLTLLLLYKNGFNVGKYISIERAIEGSKETYYDALQASSHRWETGENDPAPFASYMLGVILSCYKKLDERVALVASPATPEDAVRRFFERNLGARTKQEVVEGCPEYSFHTVERAIQRLLKSGALEKVGAARSTAYVYKGWA